MTKFAAGTIDGLYPCPVEQSNEADMYAAYDTALFEAEADDFIYMSAWLSPSFEDGKHVCPSVNGDTEISLPACGNIINLQLLLANVMPLKFVLQRRYSYAVSYSFYGETLQELVANMRKDGVRGTFNVEFTERFEGKAIAEFKIVL